MNSDRIIKPIFILHNSQSYTFNTVSRNSVGDMAAGCGIESRHRQDFSPLRIVQTGSVAHPASYRMGKRGFFLGG
jgi:hypothetical protein